MTEIAEDRKQVFIFHLKFMLCTYLSKDTFVSLERLMSTSDQLHLVIYFVSFQHYVSA